MSTKSGPPRKSSARFACLENTQYRFIDGNPNAVSATFTEPGLETNTRIVLSILTFDVRPATVEAVVAKFRSPHSVTSGHRCAKTATRSKRSALPEIKFKV